MNLTRTRTRTLAPTAWNAASESHGPDEGPFSFLGASPVDEENVFTLIARAENDQYLTPSQVRRIITHYQTALNKRNDTISRVRETLNAFSQ